MADPKLWLNILISTSQPAPNGGIKFSLADMTVVIAALRNVFAIIFASCQESND